MAKSHKRLFFLLPSLVILTVGAFAMSATTWFDIKAETTSYTLTLEPINNPVSVVENDAHPIFNAQTALANKIRFICQALYNPASSPSPVVFAGKTTSSFENLDPFNGLTSITVQGFMDDPTWRINFFVGTSVSPCNREIVPSTQAMSFPFAFNGQTFWRYQATATIGDADIRYAKIGNVGGTFFFESVLYTYTCIEVTAPVVVPVSSSDGATVVTRGASGAPISSGGDEDTTSHISG